MIRVYNRLNSDEYDEMGEFAEAYRMGFERFASTEVDRAAFMAADAINMAFAEVFAPTISVEINAHTGNWSMTLKNPEEGLRVVITGEREELPLIKAALGI